MFVGLAILEANLCLLLCERLNAELILIVLPVKSFF